MVGHLFDRGSNKQTQASGKTATTTSAVSDLAGVGALDQQSST